MLPRRYSTNDWRRVLWQTPQSTVLRRVMQPVLSIMVFSLIVSLVYWALPVPALSFKPHSLVGSALSLLLVFRTNAAYTRFWEGRQRWQQIADHVRTLSRYVMLFEQQIGAQRHDCVARLLCAFPPALKEHLRGSSVSSSDVDELLQMSDVASLRGSLNKPLHLVNSLSQKLASVPDSLDPAAMFSSRERLTMLKIVSQLSDCIGACERIVLTPVPLHYARHTSRLATIFVFTLPLVLARELSFGLAPVMGFITWALFGIQEIGLMIEDPFLSAIKLDSIVASIQRDVHQTLNSRKHDQYAEQPSSPCEPDQLVCAKDDGETVQVCAQ